MCYITFENTSPPGVPLIVEKGAKLDIELSKDEFIDFSISGGKYNASMLKIFKIYTDFERNMKAFNKEIESIDPQLATEETKKETTNTYNNLILKRAADIENFVKTEPTSCLSSLIDCFSSSVNLIASAIFVKFN